MTEEPTEVEKSATSPQIPLIWRIVAIIIAVVIIVVLLSPQVRQRLSDMIGPATPAETSGARSETGDATTAKPEAANPEIANENSPEALFKLGQAYYQSGRWEEAIVAYQKAVALKPDYQTAYVNLGDAYYQRQQLDSAVEAYQQALNLNPDDAEVFYNLGATYLQQALAAGQTAFSGRFRKGVDPDQAGD